MNKALVRRCKGMWNSESGSLIPLTSGLFLLLLILSLGLVNLSDSFLAKRELIQIAEASAQAGTHNLALQSYYESSAVDSAQGGGRIPIDCAAAELSVNEYVHNSALRGAAISITGFACHDNQVDVVLRSYITPIVSFPIFVEISGGRIPIDAAVSAISIFGQ